MFEGIDGVGAREYEGVETEESFILLLGGRGGGKDDSCA